MEVPLLGNLYGIPYSIKLPDVESFFKSPTKAPTTEKYMFRYLDVFPAELPCSQQTLVIREEYIITERLLIHATAGNPFPYAAT